MSWAIWITGPPGSGKSTIARAAASMLAADGVPVRVLEMDDVAVEMHALYVDVLHRRYDVSPLHVAHHE